MDLFDMDELDKDAEKAKRIIELEKLIVKYQTSYYNGEGEISDAEFDKLWDELKSLDPGNRILHKVGADSGNFAKAKHVMPMGSQEKASCPEEFLEWAKKHVYPEYLVEYKLDGASLELQYEDGKLVRAVTRGNGEIGDDITANAIKMKGVVKNVGDFTGGVRGEVIMTHQVHKDLYSEKANCRNAANGLMKRKDGVGSENLVLITYDVWSTTGEQPYKDEEEKINWLKDKGFFVVPLEICSNPEAVIEYRASVMEKRKYLDYDIDGLVIKERVVNHSDAMRDRPDRQIAFKFSLEEQVSVLRSVEWNENGATYTPVAVFDPVELNGTVVQRASLANPNNILSLGLQIGNRVVVVKRGEIIPKIESVLPVTNETLSPVIMPDTCSSCGTKLINEGTRLYCPNKGCGKRVLHQLLKWADVLEIRDLGEALLTSLHNTKKVNSISDLYKLTEEDLVPYFLNDESIQNEKESLGAKKVVASIKSHNNISLEKFIAGFDIEGVGETIVEKLTLAGYDTFDKLINVNEDQVIAVHGFAETMAKILVGGLSENVQEMKYLLDNGHVVLKEKSSGGILSGKSFCFTGELYTLKRADAQKLVKELGGAVKSSVVKDLSYLVTNDTSSGSSKNVKAQSLGVSIIDEKQFLNMCGR